MTNSFKSTNANAKIIFGYNGTNYSQPNNFRQEAVQKNHLEPGNANDNAQISSQLGAKHQISAVRLKKNNPMKDFKEWGGVAFGSGKTLCRNEKYLRTRARRLEIEINKCIVGMKGLDFVIAKKAGEETDAKAKYPKIRSPLSKFDYSGLVSGVGSGLNTGEDQLEKLKMGVEGLERALEGYRFGRENGATEETILSFLMSAKSDIFSNSKTLANIRGDYKTFAKVEAAKEILECAYNKQRQAINTSAAQDNHVGGYNKKMNTDDDSSYSNVDDGGSENARHDLEGDRSNHAGDSINLIIGVEKDQIDQIIGQNINHSALSQSDVEAGNS